MLEGGLSVRLTFEHLIGDRELVKMRLDDLDFQSDHSRWPRYHHLVADTRGQGKNLQPAIGNHDTSPGQITLGLGRDFLNAASPRGP
jgi:hypothetical protein